MAAITSRSSFILPQLEADVPRDWTYGIDWSWRVPALRLFTPAFALAPPSGSDLGAGLRVEHESQSDLWLFTRPKLEAARAALKFESFGFEGSALSLSTDLPSSFLETLTGRHIVAVFADLRCEEPCAVEVGFELSHGPSTLRLQAPLDEEGCAEFDLGLHEVQDLRLKAARIWLRFAAPQINAITLRDFYLLRYPRATL